LSSQNTDCYKFLDR